MPPSLRRFALVLPVLLLLAACGTITLPAGTETHTPVPSPLPRILSPTAPFVPTLTFTPPDGEPTATETPTATFLPSPTAVALSLVMELSGCNTSLDITHGMGEVTNAYALIKNYTSTDLTNVCATLTASDEERPHPDKTACTALLPSGHQVLLKLTVDTGFEKDTSIEVEIVSQEGQTASVTATSCRALGLPGWVPDKVGVVERIP
jgi:hypothetical protein